MNAALQYIDFPIAGACDAFFAPPAAATLRTWNIVRAAHADDGPFGDRAFVLPLTSGRTALIVIDVAGHGAARAPLSSIIADEIKASLLRDNSAAVALDCADKRLRTFDDELPYAVAFIALVHMGLRTVVYASAGHDVAFTLRDDGRTRDLAPTAPMLGIPLTLHAYEAKFTLDPKETLVIATDGVSDSRPRFRMVLWRRRDRARGDAIVA